MDPAVATSCSKSSGAHRTITNDGVSIAKEIELEDPYEKIGAELVKEVAKKTDDVAGDGTTTATVLAQALVREGLRNVAAGADPLSLKRGIEKAVEAVTNVLLNNAIDIETKEQIAATAGISAGDPAIGELIAEAIDKVGKEGVVTVEESNTFGLELELTEGMRFDKGYISGYFVTDTDRQEAVLEDPYILIVNSKISNVKDLLPVLEKVQQSNKPLFIIAEDVEGEALAVLVLNKLKGTFKSVAVRLRGFGDRRKAQLADIAILTGGQVVSEEVGLKLDKCDHRSAGHRPQGRHHQGRDHHRRGRRRRREIAGRVAQIRAEIENSDSATTVRSCRNVWPSWPAALQSSRPEPPPRLSSRKPSTASKMPCATPRLLWKRESSPVAASRSSRRARPHSPTSHSRETRPPVANIVKVAIGSPAEADRHERRPRSRWWLPTRSPPRSRIRSQRRQLVSTRTCWPPASTTRSR